MVLETLKPSAFSKCGNESYEIIDCNFIMNFLLQQGYVSINKTIAPHKIKFEIPNTEVKLEFEELLTVFFKRIYKFDPAKMNECCDYFMNMKCRARMPVVKT